MKRNVRKKDIVEAIRITMSSFDSHLEWCHREDETGKKRSRIAGSTKFHKKTNLEYLRVIDILFRLL